MKKTKISILLPVWERPEVFAIVMRQLERFTNSNKAYDFLVFFIVSNNDSFLFQNLSLINNSGLNFKTFEFSNHSLGQKLNFGIEKINELEYDFIMNLGSDDLLHSDLLKLYEPYLNSAIIGIDSCVFCQDSKNILNLKYYNKDRAVGAGRLISKKVIDTILNANDTLYSKHLSRGLDADSAMKMQNYGFSELVLSTDKPLIIDIKSDVNINSFENIAKHYNFDKISFEVLKQYYDATIINSIEKGFTTAKIMETNQVELYDVYLNKTRMYTINNETERAIMLGSLKHIEKPKPEQPEAEKELKPVEIITKELKTKHKTKGNGKP